MAEHLSSYTLTFTDKDDITTGREPYIYLLNTYGIITGTDQNQFQPKSTVTREQWPPPCSPPGHRLHGGAGNQRGAAWLYRLRVAGGHHRLRHLQQQERDPPSPFNSDLSGSYTISPAGGYPPSMRTGMLVDSALLQPGTYARVCYDEDGTPMAVRLSGKLDTVAGTVVGRIRQRAAPQCKRDLHDPAL